MGYEIEISYEVARGCGFRHGGNDYRLYLMGSGEGEPCECMPFALTVCPCCGEGYRYSRSPRKVQATAIFAHSECTGEGSHSHHLCPVCTPEKAGTESWLIWIGEKHYPSANDYMLESMANGVSRHIKSVPQGFKVGESWVLLAHKKALAVVEEGEVIEKPAIFYVYKPSRIDIVVNTENPDELSDTVKNLKDSLGDDARIVKVVPIGNLEKDEEDDE